MLSLLHAVVSAW